MSVDQKYELCDFVFAHVGIHAESAEHAKESAERLLELFGLPVIKGNSSYFSSHSIEIRKEPYFGTHGHIGIGTRSVERAMEMLSLKGVEFLLESSQYNEGRLTGIYLKDEVCGFAIHLMERMEEVQSV